MFFSLSVRISLDLILFISLLIIFSIEPDPKIFSFALTSAKANKENSIMIGDDLKVDILGAENFGIRAVYFNPDMNLSLIHI